jgi:hypothetical protein
LWESEEAKLEKRYSGRERNLKRREINLKNMHSGREKIKDEIIDSGREKIKNEVNCLKQLPNPLNKLFIFFSICFFFFFLVFYYFGVC